MCAQGVPWPGIAACAAAVWLEGCAAPPIAVTDSTLWPFEELQIRTPTAGPITAYLSRAMIEPRRFVIVVQSPPCAPRTSATADAAAVSTAGVLWEQFKHDATFLQFERPGGSSRAGAPRTRCRADFRDALTIDRWSRAASEGVAAIRARESLGGLASVYVGAGEGALPAAQLAAADRRASALILMSASGVGQRLEWLVAALHADAASMQAANDRANSMLAAAADGAGLQPARPASYWRSVLEENLPALLAARPDLPVMIVHAVGDQRAPIETALALFSDLARRDRPLAMLVVRHAGPDLGLSGARPECYETVVREIGARLDRWSRRNAKLPGELAVIDCNDAPGQERAAGMP